MPLIYHFDKFVFNTATSQLLVDGNETEIRGKVSELLLYFLDNKGRIISKEEIIDQLWRNTEVVENSLSQVVKELRACLGDSPKNPIYIKTIPRRGFRWVHQDTQSTDRAQPSNYQQLTSSHSTPEGTRLDLNDQTKTRSTFSYLNFRQKIFVGVIATAICLLVASQFIFSKHKEIIQQPLDQLTLAILPASNLTQSESNAWVERGLRDLVAGQMANLGVKVQPFDKMEKLLSQSGTPDTRAQLVSFLHSLDVDYLLHVEFIEAENEYSLTYKLVGTNGENITNTLITKELLGAVIPLSKGLIEQISLPRKSELPQTWLSSSSTANEDYARGIQSLHTEGAYLAQSYFEAALVRDPGFHAAQDKLAECLFKLAKWNQAKKIWEELSNIDGLPNTVFQSSQVGLGKVAVRQGRLVYAIETLEQLLANKNLTPAIKRNANLYLAEVSRSQERFADNVFFLSQADLNTNSTISIEGRASSLLLNALTISKDEDTPPLANQITHAVNAKFASALWPFQVDIQYNPRLVDLEKARIYYRQINNKEQHARTLLTTSYLLHSDLDATHKKLLEAEALYQELRYAFELADVTFELSQLAVLQSKWTSAIELSQKSIRMANSIDDIYVAIRAHRQLSQLLLAKSIKEQTSEPLERAQFHAEQSKRLALKLGNNVFIGNSYLALGATALEMKDWDEVNHWTTLAEAIYLARKDDISLSTAKLVSARSYIEQGREELSLPYFKDIKQILPREYRNPIFKSNTEKLMRLVLLHEAQALYQLGNVEDALDRLDEAQQHSPTAWPSFYKSNVKIYRAASGSEKAIPPFPLPNLAISLLEDFR